MWKKTKSYIRQLFDVYVREFKLVLHDGGIVLFLAFLPLAYPVLYSLIYNPEVVRDVSMVVVDHDRTARSRELVRNIDATQEAWVIGYATDLNEARRAMDSHHCYGILEIPEGFGKKIGRGEQANAVMYCDMSLLLRYRGFLVATTNVAQEMGGEILNEQLNSTIPLISSFTEAGSDLLPIENVAMGNIESGFDSFIMPGVIILILHQCIILACGMAGGAKHEDPRKIGYNPLNYEPSVLMSMLGQMLCLMTLIFVPMLFLVHYVPLIFSFPMAGNLWEILAFLLPMEIACLGLGFCLQGITWERESVFVLWVATSVAFLFLSGLTWPRFAMPTVWKVLSDIVPATWGVEGFIRMNTNGASLSQVSGAYINLWILAVLYNVAAYFVQRYVVRPDIKARVIALTSARYSKS